MSQPPSPPVLRIIGGGVPTDAEIAALVVALAAASGGPAQPNPVGDTEDHWADPARLVRRPVHPSGWWAYGLPR